MLAQSANVLDWDENPVSLSVIELEVLCCRAIACLQQLGARVSAESVGHVYDQFAEMKGRCELCGQPDKCTPLLLISNFCEIDHRRPLRSVGLNMMVQVTRNGNWRSAWKLLSPPPDAVKVAQTSQAGARRGG